MKVINALMDDWGNRYEGRVTQGQEDPNAEARRFAASQEFARKTMERMLRQEDEEEERERHENQTTQGASASKGTRSTNDVESGRRAAAAGRDVEGCPDCPQRGLLMGISKREANERLISTFSRTVAKRNAFLVQHAASRNMPLSPPAACPAMAGLGWAKHRGRHVSPQLLAPRWAPRLQPPTQRNAHQHKHANTKTHTKIHKTQTQTQKRKHQQKTLAPSVHAVIDA